MDRLEGLIEKQQAVAFRAGEEETFRFLFRRKKVAAYGFGERRYSGGDLIASSGNLGAGTGASEDVEQISEALDLSVDGSTSGMISGEKLSADETASREDRVFSLKNQIALRAQSNKTRAMTSLEQLIGILVVEAWKSNGARSKQRALVATKLGALRVQLEAQAGAKASKSGAAGAQSGSDNINHELERSQR